MYKPLALVLSTTALSAQAQWTQLTPVTSPSPRTEVNQVSDGTAAWLFGGLHGPSATAFNELWRFDGTNWAQQTPAASPPARSRFAMGMDLPRGVIVVFGGDAQYAGGGALGDTWEYDTVTATWTQFTPATAPAPRIHARMAFDWLNNATMFMFGGRGAVGAEAWQWDHNASPPNWVMLPGGPPAREQPHLATNFDTFEIVMFGGSTTAGNSGILSDTWTWNGASMSWTQQFPATTPGVGGIRNGKLTYDTLRDRIVLFGGVASGTGFSDTVWEYDGADWASRPSPTSPTTRAGLGFCYVGALGTTVAFGGYNGAFFDDTWTWQTNSVAVVAASGTGCPTSGGVPTLSVSPLPWAGDTVDLTIGNVPPGALRFLVWDLFPTTTSLAPFGYPGCDAINQTAVVFTTGPVPFSIPGGTSFAGVQLSAQGAVIELSGSTLGLGLTDVRTLTIGAR